VLLNNQTERTFWNSPLSWF